MKLFFIPLFILAVSSLFGMPDEDITGKIPFIKKGHHIVVTAKINNSKNDYNFIIDTGGLTFINKTVVQELSLKQNGPMAKINIMNLSGYQIEKIFCNTAFDFNMFKGDGIPIHGIIGSDLLERFKVTFDFQSSFVVFSTDTSSLSQTGNSLFFTFHNHKINNAPIINFKINGKDIEGMIDTGQPFPVVLPIADFEQFQKSNDNEYIQSKGLMIKWPQTKLPYNFLTRIKSCEFGNLKLNNAICIFGEIPSVLSMPLIGTDLLSQFKMILDYPKHEMMLIPNANMHFENNLFSLGLNPNVSENNEIFVESVWVDSPADKSNIQVGDHIISFDSIKATPENLVELKKILKDDNIKSINFEIKNKDGLKKENLNKALLF